MEDGGADVACGLDQRLIADVMRARQKFFRGVALQGAAAGDDASRQTQGLCGNATVLVGGEVVRRNRRMGARIGALDTHAAARAGAQIAYAGGEGVKAM